MGFKAPGASWFPRYTLQKAKKASTTTKKKTTKVEP